MGASGSMGRGVDCQVKREIDAEWVPGPDGILERDAARVVLFDPAGRTFLVRGHDVDDAGHQWWFTVGGGMNAGESEREAACRELAEETGLAVKPARLVGPVLRRTAAFRFVSETRRQREAFFLVHVDAEEAEAIGTGRRLTALEEEVLDEFRWWPVDGLGELAATQALYPSGFAEMAARWLAGWDGECAELEEP